MRESVDLIAVDAGSMDAGPYYLGANAQYVGESALRRDLERLIEAALSNECRLIVGSAGFSGGNTPLRETVELAQSIVEGMGADGVRMSVIPSGVSGRTLLESGVELFPLGDMPELTEEDLLESEIVAQMGIEPITTAIESGAQIILCGRAYDPAVFAADPIRQGYDPGICYHAAKILECGAIACEPGSGSDCLVAEFHRDGRAEFYSPNPERSATVRSIAAHTLYEKARPDVFLLPGGELDVQKARFEQVDESTVSLSGSRYRPKPYSVKLEGARRLGRRLVSIIPLATVEGVDEDARVYGRNGVEDAWANPPIEEIGIVVVVEGGEEKRVREVLSSIRSTLLHFGYEGRVSTAGNLAFPFSPSELRLQESGGKSRSLLVAGTRDPYFQKELPAIKRVVLKTVEERRSGWFQDIDVSFAVADAESPIAVLETVAPTDSEARRIHTEKEERLRGCIDREREAFYGINAGDAFVWSIYHLVTDKETVRKLFQVKGMEFAGGKWNERTALEPRYECEFRSSIEEEQASSLVPESPDRETAGKERKPLRKLARVIRSKNAGINEITFDIIFDSKTRYRAALKSGRFTEEGVADLMGVARSDVLGSYRFDPALALKFTLKRGLLCGSPGERDVFGAQQHSKLLNALV